MVRGSGSVRREVAGDIEYRVGGLARSRSNVGDRERASGTKRHRDRVRSVIAGREVQGRAGWVVHRIRADEEIARAVLACHGQVAGHGSRTGWHSAVTRDPERLCRVGTQRTRETACATSGVEDAGRRYGVIRGRYGDPHRQRHRPAGVVGVGLMAEVAAVVVGAVGERVVAVDRGGVRDAVAHCVRCGRGSARAATE